MLQAFTAAVANYIILYFDIMWVAIIILFDSFHSVEGLADLDWA